VSLEGFPGYVSLSRRFIVWVIAVAEFMLAAITVFGSHFLVANMCVTLERIVGRSWWRPLTIDQRRHAPALSAQAREAADKLFKFRGLYSKVRSTYSVASSALCGAAFHVQQMALPDQVHTRIPSDETLR
jgi:hypothetical protein